MVALPTYYIGKRTHISNLLPLHVLNYLLWRHQLWIVPPFLNQLRPKYAFFNHQDNLLQNTEAAVPGYHLPHGPGGIIHPNQQPFLIPLLIKLLRPVSRSRSLPSTISTQSITLESAHAMVWYLLPKGWGLCGTNIHQGMCKGLATPGCIITKHWPTMGQIVLPCYCFTPPTSDAVWRRDHNTPELVDLCRTGLEWYYTGTYRNKWELPRFLLTQHHGKLPLPLFGSNFFCDFAWFY